MKPTSSTNGTTSFIPALVGIFITLGTVWGLHAAYPAPLPEPAIVVVETSHSAPIAITPKPVSPPLPSPRPLKPIVATVPPPTPTPQPTSAPTTLTPPTPTVKKVATAVKPSRRTSAS